MYILSNEKYQNSRDLKKDNKKIKNKVLNINKMSFLKKVIFNITLILLFSIIIFVGINIFVADSSETDLVEVKIKNGDNLWKIADRFYDNDVDLRKIIYEIKKINELDSAMLRPGQKLKIPVHK